MPLKETAPEITQEGYCIRKSQSPIRIGDTLPGCPLGPLNFVVSRLLICVLRDPLPVLVGWHKNPSGIADQRQ